MDRDAALSRCGASEAVVSTRSTDDRQRWRKTRANRRFRARIGSNCQHQA